ncbi:MAG TPA: DUF6252 family protein [Flavitalea sp.]|nr:DUF6252 family protein [Flavitalea sp.]
MFNPLKSTLCGLMLLLLAGCSKELSIDTLGSDDKEVVVTGKLKMTINGKLWVADKIAAATIYDGSISVYGISNDKKAFIISLNDEITGEYQLDQSSLSVAAWTDSSETNKLSYTTNQSSDLVVAGGKVFVTKIDTVKKLVSGTFQMNLFREDDGGKKTIVDGVFEDITYSGEAPTTGGPVNPDNLLKVSIDGTVYVPKQITAMVAQANLFINGAELDGTKALALFMPSDIVAGTYQFDKNSGKYTGLYVVSPFESYMAEDGKLIILEHDKTAKKIRGTFEFKGAHVVNQTSKQFTKGSFTVSYN